MPHPDQSTERQKLLETVRAAFVSGLCINPPRQDGSKAPLGESDQNHKWERFKTERPTREQVSGWYMAPERTGLGLFCGSVSGNLEVLDFDDRSIYEEYRETAFATGLGTLVERIEAGYLESSPKGIHWLYRCSEVAGNTKLATRPKGQEEQQHAGEVATLIETRGEGGYIIIAPTFGTVNPAGPYVLQAGCISTIPTITPEERSQLHDLAKSFHIYGPESLAKVTKELEPPRKEGGEKGERPGDVFKQQVSWNDVLAPHGWRSCYTRGETEYWTRPGKEFGVSATTNHAGSDLLYVFSSSTAFEPERGYNKFSAFTTLNHGGDFMAAAKDLAQQGYGASGSQVIPSVTSDVIIPEVLTDTRVAQSFAQLFRDSLRYWPKAGKWLVYDGKRWNTDTPGGAYPFIKGMVRVLYEAAPQIEDATKRVAFISSLLKLESHPRQTTILEAATVVPELVIGSHMLDRDPMLFNVRNGTLDLTTGTLRPHRPEDFITRYADIEYDSDAECPVFKAFLSKVLEGKTELIEYLQRFVGYCLTGRTDEQVLLFLYGTGANGKTTLANVVEALLFDFATTASSDLLMQRDNRGASNDLAALRGARLVKVSEFDDGARLAESQIKTLTGGDSISCRFLYGEYFQYTPTYKIMLLGNYKPTVRGKDEGIWRRIHLLPFKVRIPDEDKDPALLDKLKAELPGILTWAVQGCMRWLEIGLQSPEEVRAEVAEYRRSEDIMQQWIDECCVVGLQYRATANDLLRSFEEFSNWKHLSSQKFGRMLTDAGFEKQKSGFAYWCGVGLLRDTPSPQEGKSYLGGLGGYSPFSVKVGGNIDSKEFTEKSQNPPNPPSPSFSGEGTEGRSPSRQVATPEEGIPNSPSPCRSCGGTEKWRTRQGDWKCRKCSPPAPGAEVIDGSS